jgi:hypothetical protein
MPCTSTACKVKHIQQSPPLRLQAGGRPRQGQPPPVKLAGCRLPASWSSWSDPVRTLRAPGRDAKPRALNWRRSPLNLHVTGTGQKKKMSSTRCSAGFQRALAACFCGCTAVLDRTSAACQPRTAHVPAWQADRSGSGLAPWSGGGGAVPARTIREGKRKTLDSWV